MLKQRIATGLLAAGALVAVSASPALAYNATPETQNATVGQSVTITFGTYNPFTPGSEILWGSTLNPDPAGECIERGQQGPPVGCSYGPQGRVFASSSGIATVTFTPQTAGRYYMIASEGDVDYIESGDAIVVVTSASSSGGSTSGGSTSGSSSSTGSSSSLPKTGASINPAVVATLSGGLLLAGAGTFVFANRRRQTASK